MQSFMGADSGLMNRLNKIADILMLNVLYLITSLPVITVGAGTTALYDVVMKLTKDEEGYIVRDYFRTFRECFKRSTALWGLSILAGILAGADIYFYMFSGMGRELPVFNYLFSVVILCFLFIYSWLFAVQAKFRCPAGMTVKKAAFLALRHLPYTVAVTLLNLIPVILVLVFPVSLPYVLLVELVCGFSGTAYINSLLFNRVFAGYRPEEKSSMA